VDFFSFIITDLIENWLDEDYDQYICDTDSVLSDHFSNLEEYISDKESESDEDNVSEYGNLLAS